MTHNRPSSFSFILLQNYVFYPFILASLWYHWRANLAVACGVAVGTAVLTGAPLGGRLDARKPAATHLDRLGHVEEALVSNHLFRAELADEVDASGNASAPAILLRVSLENPDPASAFSGESRRIDRLRRAILATWFRPSAAIAAAARDCLEPVAGRAARRQGGRCRACSHAATWSNSRR